MLNFQGMKDGERTDFWHFYMGNLSVPRDLIGEQRFDEDFKGYGWEDIVFGYAFLSRGYHVFYSAKAKAYHWDEYREENLNKYMGAVGKSAVLAEQKHPGVGFVPPAWKRMIFHFFIFCGTLVDRWLPQSMRWYLQMKQSFLGAVSHSSSSL